MPPRTPSPSCATTSVSTSHSPSATWSTSAAWPAATSAARSSRIVRWPTSWRTPGPPSHLVLPAVTLALPSVAMVARMTRSAVLDVLREDYVRTARAKGVGEFWVLARHALRNAFIPIVTLLGLQSGQLMGGAVLTETVFAWPGLGRLMVKAIFARDYVLLQGAVLLFALAFVIIDLVVDLSYGFLDPRVGRQG